MKINSIYFVIAILLIISSCTEKETKSQKLTLDSTIVEYYLAKLSSDEFLGRMPFSEGEELTVNFIKDEMQKAGIEPGNGDSYFQDVNLVQINSNRDSLLEVNLPSKKLDWTLGKDFVTSETRVEETTSIENSQFVFAGFGIVAPEYGWNDYEGLDMTGKTAIVMVNDPGYQSGDSELFTGNAMTYYGRWTYKYEEAARQGADGVMIIHETEAASYPWSTVKNSWKGAEMVVDLEHKNLNNCRIQGWISNEAARELFESAGLSYEDLTEKAGQKGFKPVELGATYSYSMTNEMEFNTSKNVIGKITGTKYPEETIIYTAHWDHLGIGEKVDGDSIYNGAVDNATGVAAIMEIGRAFAQLETKPERSIIILAVTAEEQGLLGSKYYSENPIYPLDKTVANLNIDAIMGYGRTKDITVIGYGQSELDEIVKSVADRYNLEVNPDPHPEKGYFFRSDHINFAKMGVPSFYGKLGNHSIAHGLEWGKEQENLYRLNDYHNATDNYDPEIFDLGGILQVGQVMLDVGYELSFGRTFPGWKEGASFSR